MKRDTNPFKWRHFESEIILLCVHWYRREVGFRNSRSETDNVKVERALSDRLTDALGYAGARFRASERHRVFTRQKDFICRRHKA